jgi:hypothetical protein
MGRSREVFPKNFEARPESAERSTATVALNTFTRPSFPSPFSLHLGPLLECMSSPSIRSERRSYLVTRSNNAAEVIGEGRNPVNHFPLQHTEWRPLFDPPPPLRNDLPPSFTGPEGLEGFWIPPISGQITSRRYRPWSRYWARWTWAAKGADRGSPATTLVSE